MSPQRYKLYAPIAALIIVQGALALFAPTSTDQRAVSAVDGLVADGGIGATPGVASDVIPEPDGAAAVPADGSIAEPTASGGEVVQPVDGADATTVPDPAASAGGLSPTTVLANGQQPPPTTSAAPSRPPGDTSHCVNGRQSDVVYHEPPCQPAFAGDNGGATYRGVTDSEVKLVNFECSANDQVAAILAAQNLGATTEEKAEFMQAAVSYMNERYEFYGRQIVAEYIIGDCATSPPDPARERAAAEDVARKAPFVVMHTAGGNSTHGVWTRNEIISWGGSYQVVENTAGRRPFRWDVNLDGTQTADAVSEYYCKKMAGDPADHAGTQIHISIPGGRSAPRQPGIVSLDNGNGTHLPSAERMAKLIGECEGVDVPIFTYPSDVTRATELSRAIVAGLIEAKVTTVICHCDPIGPSFFTNDMTQNNYFPEHVLTGGGLMDLENLARLYDKRQWNHAFGLSQLLKPLPIAETDAARVWRAAGKSGDPCNVCNLLWDYYSMIGTMIQQAGPNLNPLSAERALETLPDSGGWAQTGGRSEIGLMKFGPGDHTALSDFREVYWSDSAISTGDGNAGTYVEMNGGRRYRVGEQTGEFTIPVAPL